MLFIIVYRVIRFFLSVLTFLKTSIILRNRSSYVTKIKEKTCLKTKTKSIDFKLFKSFTMLLCDEDVACYLYCSIICYRRSLR